MDAVPGCVAGGTERDEVLVRIAPGCQLVPRTRAPVILAVVDLQAGARTAMATGMSIPGQDGLPLPLPCWMKEQVEVVAVMERHSLGPWMGQREGAPVQSICTDVRPLLGMVTTARLSV